MKESIVLEVTLIIKSHEIGLYLELWITNIFNSYYLFLSCNLFISLVWSKICFSSLFVERECSKSWSSSLVVWFNTCT
jgi:hypothetical protein